MKAPYKYRMPLAEVTQTVLEIKETVHKFSQDGAREFLQCNLIKIKPVKYGVKFCVWLLGMRLGDFGPGRGCSSEEWERLCGAAAQTLMCRFPGCNPYVEKLTRTACKAQFSFETYIRYSEHDKP